MDFVRFLHSWTRWGVVIVAVIAVVWMLLGLVQKRAYSKNDGLLMTAFSSLIGLQWLIGVVLIIIYGSQVSFNVRYIWEHLTVMTIALAVAHAHYAYKRRALPDSTRYRNNLLVIVATFVLIFIGIALLPSGIQWRFVGL